MLVVPFYGLLDNYQFWDEQEQARNIRNTGVSGVRFVLKYIKM